jgi:ornithine cyclodeaminase/alanine dehydrogenase-like protein (mu-crystallin family)
VVLKLLSASDIRRALPMDEAIRSVETAFIEFSAGRAEMPPRTRISPDPSRGTTLFMPAYLPSSSALGAKVISIFPANVSRSIPTIHALVLMIDPATGLPLGLLDGSTLTALRTGAASGVATKHLSRADASAAAIFGAGVQGRTQLEAVCAVRSIHRACVFDPSTGRAEEFAREMSARGGAVPRDIRIASTPAEAVRETDIICTATTALKPVFRDADLPSGVHINAVGSYEPHVQEIPVETLGRAVIVVDSLEASFAETGDFIIPVRAGLFSREMVRGEIGRIASGDLPGRRSDSELTLFKSVGLAVQDMAVAARALDRAARLDLGTTVGI